MRPKLGKNNQQWIFDYVIRTTGKTAHFELDAGSERLPPEVRTWEMIPKYLGKKAAKLEEFARRAEEAGHSKTAWEIYRKACDAYFRAQHAICQDDNPEKIRLNQKVQLCNEKVRKYNEYPIEKIEIPWGDKTIPGLLHLLPDRRKAPCVLYIPGMDQGKETFPHQNGMMVENPFIKRGMHVLSIDGPGQGECNLRKIRVSPENHREAAKASIDYLCTRPEVDKDKIGLFGISMGSYWASQIAGFEKRIKATVAVLGCFMMDTHPIFEEASPRFRFTYKYMAGIEDDAEFDDLVSRMTLKGVGPRIKHPFLIWVGEFDPLQHLEEAEAFYEELAGPKEMWIMEDDFHQAFTRGIYNLPIATLVADWLRDKLDGKYSVELAKKISIPLGGAGPYS